MEGARFGYGSNTLIAAINQAVTPYVVSQEAGAVNSVPEFLNSQHKIVSSADADAYLARLERFSSVLDQETERIGHDSEIGVMPPDFILDAAHNSMQEVRGTPASESPLVTSLARRAAAAGVAGDLGVRAAKIVERVFRRSAAD